MTGPFVPSIEDAEIGAEHGDCQCCVQAHFCSPPSPRSSAHAALLTMIENADNFASPAQGRPKTCFEVRSVTGACYTLVEEADRDGTTGRLHRSYRTAYAGLPVIANDDGSFTLVDTQTRLVPVSVR